MTIRLIAIDVDDTLLTSRQIISPATKNALREKLAQGVKVVLCSGRPLAGVRHFMADLGISGDDQYVITGNGAIIETAAGRILQAQVLNRQDYLALADFAATHQVPFNVLDTHSRIYTPDRDVDRWTVVQAAENFAGLYIRQPAEMPADFQMLKAVCVGSPDQLDAVQPVAEAAFGDRFYVVRASANFLEIMHPDVDKGAALQRLAAILQLEAAQVMAIGDGNNDVPMLQWAGTGVVMGNGMETAKAGGDFVTRSNDEDGIRQALTHFADRF